MRVGPVGTGVLTLWVLDFRHSEVPKDEKGEKPDLPEEFLEVNSNLPPPQKRVDLRGDDRREKRNPERPLSPL